MTQVTNVLSQFTEDDIRMSAEAYGYGKRVDEVVGLWEALQTDGEWSETNDMRGDKGPITGTYDYPYLFEEAFAATADDHLIDDMDMGQMAALFMELLGLQAAPTAAPAPFPVQSVVFEGVTKLAEEAAYDDMLSLYESKVAAEEQASLANPDGLGKMDLADYRARMGYEDAHEDELVGASSDEDFEDLDHDDDHEEDFDESDGPDFDKYDTTHPGYRDLPWD